MEWLPNILVAILTSSIVAALVNTLLGQWAVSRQDRRDRYSEVVGSLVARLELPYRIRRRTDDSQETLRELAERIHHNQEQIVADEAWVASDSRKVLAAWNDVRAKLDPWFLEQARDSWTHNPVATGSGMNLTPPLPSPELKNELADLQSQITSATRLVRFRS